MMFQSQGKPVSSNIRGQKGLGLLEIIIAVAIISFSLFALARAAQVALSLVDQTTRISRSLFLLEEGMESVKSLRDRSWSAHIAPLSEGISYYPVFDNFWELETLNPGPIDGTFTRTLEVENVYRRDLDDDIVDPGAPDPKTLDPGTKKITVTVSWQSPVGTRSRQLETYLSNIFDN